jgi:hypothetical protein
VQDSDEADSKLQDVELVHWVKEEDSVRGWPRFPIQKRYQTFKEARDAILKNGPISIFTDRVDVTFFVLNGQFDGQLMAIRQSGVNVRRYLIREDTFEDAFGSFQQCIDMVMSNRVVENEIEIRHLREFADNFGLSTAVDGTRHYHRFDVDVIAALQLLDVLDKVLDEEPTTKFQFELGYSVGRLFGSIQNLATLEDKALMGEKYQNSYKEKGKRSGSDKRKSVRLESFLKEIERVHSANPDFSHKEAFVMELAFEKIIPKGTYGHGQFDEYCTTIRSEEHFKTRFDKLFRKVT